MMKKEGEDLDEDSQEVTSMSNEIIENYLDQEL